MLDVAREASLEPAGPLRIADAALGDADHPLVTGELDVACEVGVDGEVATASRRAPREAIDEASKRNRDRAPVFDLDGVADPQREQVGVGDRRDVDAWKAR